MSAVNYGFGMGCGMALFQIIGEGKGLVSQRPQLTLERGMLSVSSFSEIWKACEI